MDPARLEQFKKIAEQYPDDEVARYGLGSLYLHLARYAEAEGEFRAAITIKANYTAAYRELGKALRDAGRRMEAMDVLGQGVVVAERTHDSQTLREMLVFLKRLKEEHP